MEKKIAQEVKPLVEKQPKEKVQRNQKKMFWFTSRGGSLDSIGFPASFPTSMFPGRLAGEHPEVRGEAW